MSEEIFPLAEGCRYRTALGVSYCGTGYNGWQTQPDGRTVQDHLERALAKFLAVPAATICAGRTDAGVHGAGQVVHVDSIGLRRPESWVRGLNTFLPDDIAVRWAVPVTDRFHARFKATSRTYQYWIYNDRVRSPLFAGRTGWVWRACDEKAMSEGAQALLGEHDFTSFRASECQAASPVRTIHSVKVVRKGDLIGIELTANAFLQHMVRNIVGTLIYVGVGRENPKWVAEVLAAKKRALAAPTFDASGLYFIGATYPDFPDVPVRAAGPFGKI